MNLEAPTQQTSNTPSATAVRRFWIAWLSLLIAMLAAFTFLILVAAVMADPVPIPPAG